MNAARTPKGLIRLAVLVTTVVAACLATFSPPAHIASAADGDVTELAGGLMPWGPPNPVGPVPGNQIAFTVYAETILEHGGYLYIRDYDGIYKVDDETGSTQRVAGAGSAGAPVTYLPADGVPALSVGINWGRTLAFGPDGALYFSAGDTFGLGARIYRIDLTTGLLNVVAGDGSTVASGDGGPATDAGLAIDYLAYKDGLFVDDSNSIWFLDGPPSGPQSVRRIDGTTGVITTVYQLVAVAGAGSELIGFTPDGAAYFREGTWMTVSPYTLLTSRTVRVDAAGAVTVVADRRTTCDDAIDDGTVNDQRHWADNGVLSTITYSDGTLSGGSPTTTPGFVGTAVLCTVDLASGATSQRVLTGSITDFAGSVGYITILANALTTRADGTSFFVNREDNGTYKAYRWDGPGAASFVTRSGQQLMYEGQPFRFTGMNVYEANNTGACGGQFGSGNAFATAIDQMGNPQVIRSWFFQPLATTGGARDWTSFDHTLAVAEAKGVKLIATLGNQWADCDGLNGAGGKYKTDTWYGGGYNTDIDAGMIVTYRAWVAEVVARYRNNPTIMAWEILNEPEVKVSKDGACAVNAATLLNSFTTDIAALIKTTDPNHLVSLGTIGGGQCGSDNANYSTLHGNANIDLCSVHDYQQPNDPIAGDQYNGIAKRLEQCRALNKPTFVGESGLQFPEVGNSTAVRAQKLTTKMLAEFRAGMVGYVLWNWADPPRRALTLNDDIHDIGQGDEVLVTLAAAPSSWPNDGGDTDNDGVSNAVDAGAGWDDHAGTTGSVTNANGLSAVVLDAPAPEGVTVYVPRLSSGEPVRAMTVSQCGFPVDVDSGTSVTITCGSITAKVATGRVRVRISNDTFVTIPAGATAKVDVARNGKLTISNVVGTGVTVTIKGTTTPISGGTPPTSFPSWTFLWVSPRFGISPSVVNAGKPITMKWVLLDSSSRAVSTLDRVTISVTTSSQCRGTKVVPNNAPVTLTLNHGLKYLGRGVYVATWTTPKAYKGSCKEVHLDLGEGTTHNFVLKVK